MTNEIIDSEKLFAGPCDFMLSVAHLSQLPEPLLPEVAFVGRSNVGKSSLVNALTGRKTLAKTSNTPGRTQQLNFFNLGDLLYLVDLPGYGYAKVSKSLSKDWNKLIRNYLRGRVNLRCVFVLVDARHGLKDSDRDIMKLLDESAVPYRIIFTKADKQKNETLSVLKGKAEEELKKHPASYPEIYKTSARAKDGLTEMRALISSFA